jgi:formylglycine-generating enzyme required for sulfatase activity
MPAPNGLKGPFHGHFTPFLRRVILILILFKLAARGQGGMAEIKISYDGRRRKAAAHLAGVLERYGYSVCYESADSQLIREVKALVVLWCNLAVDSVPVKQEAELGAELGILVPAKIEPCEPDGSSGGDCIDLSEWSGAPLDRKLYPLLGGLAKRLGRPPQLDFSGMRAYDEDWYRTGALSLGAFGLEERMPESNHAAAAQAKPAGFAAVEANKSVPDARLGREQKAALAEEARAQQERRKREEEMRYRSEGRIRIAAAFAEPAGIEWFRPGLGQTEWFKDLAIGPEMVAVPAGRYLMGSPESEPERFANEGPQHKITIPGPFAIGRFAVTFSEWDAAQQDKDWQRITGLAPRLPRDAGWGRGNRPVIGVSWDDAQAYMKWLSEKTGKEYRLPSEAEWEYACRAGSTTPFWWGTSITTEQANYDGRGFAYSGGGRIGEFRQRTLPVESFEANPWGLYQVHGNVWEWCEDRWHSDYTGAPANGSAWMDGDNNLRVLRGGAWINNPRGLRSAFRNNNFSIFGHRNRFRGFRAVRVLASRRLA